MNFLEKLDYLMDKNHLNKSTLSKACDIPYTTIDGWYKKGYEGLKLTTLKKLSDYFGTSLDFWAKDNMLPNKNNADEESKDITQAILKSPELKTLFEMTRDMSPEMLKAHIEFIKKLSELE